MLLTGATGFVGRTLLLRYCGAGVTTKSGRPYSSPDKLCAQLVGDGFEEIPQQLKVFTASAECWDLGGLPEWTMWSTRRVCSRAMRATITAYQRRGDAFAVARLAGPASGCAFVVAIGGRPVPARAGGAPEEEPESPVTLYGESKLEMERRVISGVPWTLDYLIFVLLWCWGRVTRVTLPLFKMARGPVRFEAGVPPEIL